MGAAASGEEKEIGEGPGFEDDAEVKADVPSPPKINCANLDSFEPLKVIGEKKVGKVLLVKKKSTNEYFAMKVLRKEEIISKKHVERRLQERKILEKANSPFVLKLRYAFQTNTKLYVLTDFYKAGELFFHLRKVKRFTEDQARIIVGEALLAIEHIHSLGFIARCVLPENMWMDYHGHIVLTNLILAKELSTTTGSTTPSDDITPEYRPYEVVKNEVETKAVDWWTIGILIYELLVGVTPFYSGSVDEMLNKICNAKVKFPPRLSEPCKDIISKLLNRSTSERLGSGTLGVEEIKSHPWFQGIDWDRLSTRQLDPIFQPQVGTAPDDMSCFFEAFAKEPLVDPEETASTGSLNPSDIDAFRGFEFGNAVGEAEE
jgi:serum/glucocorticoid-regulated kinase 2